MNNSDFRSRSRRTRTCYHGHIIAIPKIKFSHSAQNLAGKAIFESSLNTYRAISAGIRTATLLLALILLASCGEEKGPEVIARDFVAACEQAAQARKISDLRDLISRDYSDPSGRTAQDVVAIGAGYLLRHQSIHIYSRLQSVVEQDGRIEVAVLAALAGRPLTDLSVLPSINADMYWFDLVLIEEQGGWRLFSGSWRQAMVDDFFAD